MKITQTVKKDLFYTGSVSKILSLEGYFKITLTDEKIEIEARNKEELEKLIFSIILKDTIELQNILPSNILIELKETLILTFFDSTLLKLYSLIYEKFSTFTYFKLKKDLNPYLDNLAFWYADHPNRALWFIISKDFRNIHDKNYFKYEFLINYTLKGTKIFENKSIIKKFFLLKTADFLSILDYIFNSDIRPIFVPLFLHYSISYKTEVEVQSKNLLSFSTLLPEPIDFHPNFSSNYLKCISFFYNLIQVQDWNSLSIVQDYVYNYEIVNNRFTSRPNISLITSKTTLKSLKRKSKEWHKKSQTIEINEASFQLEPYSKNIYNSEISLIRTPNELLEIAKEMNNCLTSYHQKIKENIYFCFYYKSITFVGVLGVKFDPYYNLYEYDQLKGLENKDAPIEDEKIAQAFIQLFTAEKL